MQPNLENIKKRKFITISDRLNGRSDHAHSCLKCLAEDVNAITTDGAPKCGNCGEQALVMKIDKDKSDFTNNVLTEERIVGYNMASLGETVNMPNLKEISHCVFPHCFDGNLKV